MRAAALNTQTVESKYNWNGFILLESMIKHLSSQILKIDIQSTNRFEKVIFLMCFLNNQLCLHSLDKQLYNLEIMTLTNVLCIAKQ